MPPPTAPSNIRAFVRWREPSVYAGEEIECIITFKNIATVPRQDGGDDKRISSRNGYPRDAPQPHVGPVPQSRGPSAAQGRATSSRAPSVASKTDGGQPESRHHPALSVDVVGRSSKGALQSAPIRAKPPNSAVSPAQGHGRSLSIMSLGSDVTSEGRAPPSGSAVKRPVRGHGRSSSLQFMPRPAPQVGQHAGGISPRQPSPLFESTTPPALAEGQNGPPPIRPVRKRPGTVSAGNTPQLGRQQNSQERSPGKGAFGQGFQFSPAPRPAVRSPSPQIERPRPPRSSSYVQPGQFRSSSPQPPDGWSGALNNLNPITRVITETSTTGTSRTSSDIYSTSNHSDETLTSEVPVHSQHTGRLLPRPSLSRQASSARQLRNQRPAGPETLMMGYAQTMGYFVLDGSLVNAAPFEEVKRKGVQGGGGVVGVEKAKRTSGMFGAFNWGNLGESLGGLLGGDEMSSMAQMKANAGSKSIPLLSTPQNLLFVDLRLAPGESKSYDYRFALPRGLPPTYRGRAIKVFYQLTLGVQRPEGQAVKRIDIPFRIIGSYNARGEALGHDLMSPYVLLQDAARSSSIAMNPSTPSEFPPFAPKTTSTSNQVKTPKQGLEDFLRYTERLLEHPKDESAALMSPTSPTTPRHSRSESVADQAPSSIKDAIDFAILRANQVRGNSKQQRSENQSSNRFNIARGGRPVAVLTLLRPAYRLGEAVIGTIDFTAPSTDSGQAPTYSVLAELESAERVDPSLALRSSTSINRVTRKIHASCRENTLFARQMSFNLTIPSTATPTFETTGVSLVWKLKVEFTTGSPGDGELLEEIGSDERGTTLIARERLGADSFEIEVPLKVFGVPGIDAMGGESEGLEI
ncbi:Golgi membrane exchange factor (Ric1p-Rgp1p) subunit [Vermiconidia calcicola]|uniref:Golgi membrane exchange factor (Ric1p-Rgp1p) subunit n=1 Tax=Vermiconidia calcicola TaxID=1690605 RepID=A0ACC3MDY4_9PEZI|nr:Golgi membrane exchange factor (Ric1p-Rgp1p) subunit [Vermiconidia calcicola]